MSLEENLKYYEPNEANPKYKEILKLEEMIKDRISTDYTKTRKMDGWAIRFNFKDSNDEVRDWISIIEFDGSYGGDVDKLEIWTNELDDLGADPIGYLSAEEVIGIIDYFETVKMYSIDMDE